MKKISPILVKPPLILGNKFDPSSHIPLPSHPSKAVDVKVLNPPLRTHPPYSNKRPYPPLFQQTKNFQKIFKKIYVPT
jgi:hypothetical protein